MNFLSKSLVVLCLFGRAFCTEDFTELDFVAHQVIIDKCKNVLIKEPFSPVCDEAGIPLDTAYAQHPAYQSFASFDFSTNDLPPSIDFRNYPPCPPIYAQEGLSSCTACAGASVVWYWLLKRNPETAYNPSRLFLYYNERVIKNEIHHLPDSIADNGAWGPDVILALHQYGVCPESTWPYEPALCDQEPSPECYEQAKLSLTQGAFVHSFVPRDLTQIKAVLAQKIPIIVGLAIYESSITPYAWRTGIIPTPTDIPNDTLAGGHEMMFIGYDDNMVGHDGTKGYFIFQNSWGEGFGDKGYGYLPYDYMMNPKLVFGKFFIKGEE